MQFGQFRLKRQQRLVEGPGGPVELSARAFEILCLLLDKPGEVIGKDEMFAAVWPNVVVEENTLQVHISTLRKVLDSGMIVTVHGRGYKYAGPKPVAVPADQGQGADRFVATQSQMPSKPSIAVLPFSNMSCDPEQTYFSDGITDDITTALSRMHGLFVISRSSSFTYKGRSVDIRQVGRELGVRYVLEGSVRRAGGKVRIAAQLVSAVTAEHLWAEHYDGLLEDVFDLQDQVTANVVGAIAPKIDFAEIERAKRKPTANLDAYDYLLRGTEKFFLMTTRSLDEALPHFYRAIELDPDFAAAHAYAANYFVLRKVVHSAPLSALEVKEAERLATRAVELGPNNDIVLALAGNTQSYVLGNVRGGTELTARALALNPNWARAWLIESWNKHWLGEFDAAIECSRRAMLLSPQDPFMFHMQEATADNYFVTGRYEEALSWAEKALSGKPKSTSAMLTKLAVLASVGQQADAESLAKEYMLVDPTYRLSLLPDQLPYVDPGYRALWLEAFRKAKMPE